ncbi:RidA family protein [Allosalinactinospora lopnorensis]|uniref:RidA family protein n=1 Tax=Allosalinactinospora lopnorensis TaxID=1352348 RepID=UPI000623DC64|nr:RidA family protein [Allosalinactinospora lopnorensis]
MIKTFDNPAGAPAPAGPYSQVVRVDVGGGSLLYVAGQIALDDDGRVVAPGDMAAQAERIFETIGQLLDAHGAAFSDIVKITAFLTDLDRRPEYASAYKKRLLPDPPASTTVEVPRLFKPEALIEVEVVAAVGSE